MATTIVNQHSSGPNGSSRTNSTTTVTHLVKPVAYDGFIDQFNFANGVWSETSHAAMGVESDERKYTYAGNGNASSIAYSGDYSGGNGTRDVSWSKFNDSHAEDDKTGQEWSTHTFYPSTGPAFTTGTASGGEEAQGTDDRNDSNGWEEDTKTTSPGYTYSGMSASSNYNISHDQYHDEESWKQTEAADGSVSSSGNASFHVNGSYSVGGQTKWSWTETTQDTASGSGSASGSSSVSGSNSGSTSGSGSGSTYTTSSNGGTSWSSGGSYSAFVNYWGFYEGSSGGSGGSTGSVFFDAGEGWTGPGSPDNTGSASGGGYLDTGLGVSEAEPGPYGGPLYGTNAGPSPELTSTSPIYNKNLPQAHVTPTQFNAALGSTIAVAQSLAMAPSVPSTPGELTSLSDAVDDYAAHDMPVAKAPPLSEVENEPPRKARQNPTADAEGLLAWAGADEVDAAAKDAPKTPHVKLEEISADERARAHELAILAHAAYGGGVAVPSDWQAELVISPETSLDPSVPEGFRAVIFRNKKTGEYVLAFAGTKLTSYADLKTSAEQAEGIVTKQYEYALLLVEKAKEFAGENLTLTGHSLGGGLASAGAIKYDVPAIVFDPAGVHPNTVDLKTEDDIRKLKPDITVFRVKGEFLTTLQDLNLTRLGYVLPDTVGKKVVDLESDLFLSSIRPFGNHSIEVIIRVLDPDPEEP